MLEQTYGRLTHVAPLRFGFFDTTSNSQCQWKLEFRSPPGDVYFENERIEKETNNFDTDDHHYIIPFRLLTHGEAQIGLSLNSSEPVTFQVVANCEFRDNTTYYGAQNIETILAAPIAIEKATSKIISGFEFEEDSLHVHFADLLDLVDDTL